MTKARNLLYIVFLLLLTLSCNKSSTSKTEAQWITHPEFIHSANQWYQIRKQINLKDAPPKSLKTLISADSKYWLYINGELVVFEGQLKRGPTPNDTYYDEVDIAPYLKKGKNTIAALLWYFGREGFSHKDSKVAGFIMQNDLFSTDNSWKIARYNAYQSTGEPQSNYRLPESNVRFDARLSDNSWIESNYIDTAWSNAKSAGKIGSAPWNKLFKRPIPQFKTFELTKIDNYEREGNIITLRFPYNLQYHPYLKVKAPAGKLIKISPENLKTLNDVPLRAEYITKEGEQTYLHLPWISGPEAHIEVEDGVEVLELGYMESGYDTEFNGTFEVEDEYLMRYFKKAQRTLYVNMRDTYYDCPDRERAQWIGDGVILIEEAFYLLDEKAIDLSRKMYTELFNWQRADSTLFGPIPAGNWENELPQQILAAVGSYGIGRYYLYSGEDDIIRYAYPHIKKYLGLWDIKEDGIVPFRKGGWTWGDWGYKIDRDLAEHIWVYIALDNFANMADIIGEDVDAISARQKMKHIKKRVNDIYWTPNGYITPGHTEGIDDRGNALAVISGIADKEKHTAIFKLFNNTENASPYMEKYVMEALFAMGEGKFAIERFKKRYANMVNHEECTTLWEFWDYGASVNHAWSGGPLSIFYKNIAGIVPTKPGFAEFNIFPELIGTNSLKCSFSTIKGIISLDITENKNTTKMEIMVPNKSIAQIRIPNNAKDINLSSESDIKADKKDNEYSYYKINPGNYTITYNK